MSDEKIQGVLICGLPCSGNRIVHGLLTYHGFHSPLITHWERGLPKVTEQIQEWEDSGVVEIHCIIPLRIEAYRWLSFCARHPEGTGHEIEFNDQGAHHINHFVPVLRYMAERGIAVLPVVYEDIVSRPEDEGRRIMAWLGVYDWKGWPIPIHDGNARWRVVVEQAELEAEPEECGAAGALRTRLSRSRLLSQGHQP